MKKVFYILFLLPRVILGQTATKNYIKTTTYKTATATSIATPTTAQAAQAVSYFDGLGRPTQQLAVKQSNSSKDIIGLREYDDIGRQKREYLPYASTQNTSEYLTSVKSQLLAQYQTLYADSIAYSDKEYEKSPLNRILKQSAPGTDWKLGSGHEVRFEYQTNVANDQVKWFKANSDFTTNAITLTNSTGGIFYPIGQLYKTITKNENWISGKNNTTEEFKDREGNIVLKRTYSDYFDINGSLIAAAVLHDTYYVYDQYGNLTYVLPPMADNNVTQSVRDALGYQYKYDFRNRLIEKKLPGKQWEFIVYDKLDRVVATGPALYPFSNTPPANTSGWLITKYDVFGRVIYTGWEDVLASSGTRATKQITQDGIAAPYEAKQSSGSIDSIAAYYTNAKAPTAFKLLSVNYYDDYAYPNPPGSFADVESQVVFYNTTVKPKGLATGIWVRAISTETSTIGESSYTLYDKKARPLRTFTKNYLTGYTQTDTNMDSFSGRVNYNVTKHKRIASDSELYVKDSYTYTDQDRVIAHTHQIGLAGTPQLLSKNNYDDLGQLTSKQVGGTDVLNYVGLQKVDYTYNIRGWMTGINDVNNLTMGSDPKDLFAFGLNYNKPITNTEGGTIKPLYNGNIAEVNWRTNSDNILRRYGYSYDNLNRLTNAVYQKSISTVQVTNSYNERLTYDKNGNVIKLKRTGEYDDAIYSMPIDNLTYSYDPIKQNQLMKVEDADINPNGFKDNTTPAPGTPNDYSYDLNGNMLTDLNKGVTNDILYNHLNLPLKIIFGTTGNIEYLYDASGKKLKKTVTSGTTVTVTDYLDGFQYTTTTGNPILEFFFHAEGYVRIVGWVKGQPRFGYAFNYTDHLGNVRLTYALSATKVLTILEENNYYPFGLKHRNYNTTHNDYFMQDGEGLTIDACTDCNYKYKYNGKEYQDELGLNMYDYGARNYDPALGRWMNMDPLAETSRRFSPYTNALNNPVFFIDPDGMEAEAAVDNSGTLEKDDYENKVDMGYGRMVDADKVSASIESTAGNSKLTEKGKKKFEAAAMKDAMASGVNQQDPGKKQKSQQHKPKVIDNNKDAVNNYYNGDGSPVELGPNTRKALLNSKEYKNVLSKLANGTARSRTNTFDVDLTFQGAFQVGNTNVDYSTSCTDGCCITTFKAFVRDSFSDPAGMGIEIPSMSPYGQVLTPHPYNYIPYVFRMEYNNPGYPIGINIK